MDILQTHSLRNPINHHMQISEEEKLVKWASYNSQICITENLPAGVNFSLTGNLLVHKALHTHTILSCKQKEEMEQIVCHELSPLYLGQWELHFHST